MRIAITTSKFNKLFIHGDHEVTMNTTERKLTEEELRDMLLACDPEAIICGTEQYSPELLETLPSLRVLSRVGIGLDNIPLDWCQEHEVAVMNTPDAMSHAVAELTVSQIIQALRMVPECSNIMRGFGWQRVYGREMRDVTVGVVGCGRIGSKVAKYCSCMGSNVLVHDKDAEQALKAGYKNSFTTDVLSCDVVTFHVPKTQDTIGYMSARYDHLLKDDVVLVNMSRGGIINEEWLKDWLYRRPKSMAVIDTWEEEPTGSMLVNMDQVLPTPHLASCTLSARRRMEIGAWKNAVEACNAE